MLDWKRMLSLLLALCLLIPCALAEEDGDTDWDFFADGIPMEEVLLDEENDFASDLVISDEIYEELSEWDAEIDDTVDHGVLEVNENLPGHIINILLVGVDTRDTDVAGQRDGNQHGDVQIILSINTETGSVKLTSLQRDLYVTLPGYKSKNRINVAYAWGQSNPKLNGSGGQFAMRVINHSFQMNIEYYATINFYGLASIVDELGGIDMELTSAEAGHINSYLRQHPPAYDNHKGDGYVRQELERRDGMQHLDGVQAVMYARTREIDNDFNRTERQRRLLEILLQKIMTEGMSVPRLMSLMDTVVPYVETNMSMTDMFNLAIGLLQSGIIERAQNGETLMEQFRIPMDDTWYYASVERGGGRMSVVDFKSGGLQKNVEALHEFIYGEYIPAK